MWNERSAARLSSARAGLTELRNDSSYTTSDEAARVGDHRLVGNMIPVLGKDAFGRLVREELDGRFLLDENESAIVDDGEQKGNVRGRF
jgi:hypothetical protein